MPTRHTGTLSSSSSSRGRSEAVAAVRCRATLLQHRRHRVAQGRAEGEDDDHLRDATDDAAGRSIHCCREPGAPVIETVTFRLAPDTDEAVFLAARSTASRRSSSTGSRDWPGAPPPRSTRRVDRHRPLALRGRRRSGRAAVRARPCRLGFRGAGRPGHGSDGAVHTARLSPGGSLASLLLDQHQRIALGMSDRGERRAAGNIEGLAEHGAAEVGSRG